MLSNKGLLQFFRYFGVALIGLVIDFSVLILFEEIVGTHYIISATAGFLAGLIVNYALSNKWVFSNPKIESKKIQFGLFLLIGLIGLGLLTLQMWLLVDYLHLNYILSKSTATVIVYLWNFFARKALYHA